MSYATSPDPSWPAPSDRATVDAAVTHPNRDKPEVRATRITVILLLLASSALVLLIAIAGWNLLSGALPVQLAFVIFYLTLAFYAGRWNRGVLPVAAALAVLLAIFALVAGPALVRPRQGRLRDARLPECGTARAAHAARHPRAAAAHRFRHARLQPGLERRARAARDL